MKTIGLIGGMSWESTITYYQVINKMIQDKLGGLHSAKCIIYSVDFHEIEQYQSQGEWEKSAHILGEAGRSLERGGADFILLCTNTMHKIAPDIERAVSIPFLHIADMTVMELKKAGMTKVGLLGTKYTMQQDFYKQILINSGIQVLIPREERIQEVNAVIFDELCLGILSAASKKIFLDTIQDLGHEGAEGIILGCTEIGHLIQQSDTDIPIFDTTFIHAKYAVKYALSTGLFEAH